MISDTTLISFYRSGDKYKIELCDINNTSSNKYVTKTFEYESDIPADKGDIVINDNSVFVSPHNKQLNLIDGEWYLNDFVSTTPLVDVVDEDSDDVNIDLITAKGFIQVIDEPSIPLFIDLGKYKITIGNHEYTTESIFNSDTKEGIALKIFRAIKLPNYKTTLTDTTKLEEYKKRVFADSGFIYNLEDLETAYVELGDEGFSLINITANSYGQFYNQKVSIQAIDGNASSRELLNSYVVWTDIFGGSDIEFLNNSIGTLEQQTDYYYKARYVYSDGHITKTNFPTYFRTTNLKRLAILNIEIVKDLDNSSFVGLEIFRKKEGGVFQLIKKINNTEDSYRVGSKYFYRFIDTGFFESEVLDEQEYVWTTKHKTHTIARDRYLRSNVEYRDRVSVITGELDYEDTEEGEVIPFNSVVQSYTKSRFNDGLESFFNPVDKLTYRPDNVLNSLDRNLKINLDPDFSDLKEVGVYVKYNNLEQNRFVISFDSIEFYNQNIPSFATFNEDIKDQPANPHVFYGWRYLRFDATENKYQIFDSEWDRNPQAKDEPDNFKDFWFEVNDITVIEESETEPKVPTILSATTAGITRTYKLIKRLTSGILYELVGLEQLKIASVNNKLKLRYVPGNFLGLSGPSIQNENLLGLEVNALISDKSENYSQDSIDESYPPRENRVYFVLPSDSDFSNVTFSSFTVGVYDSRTPDVQPNTNQQRFEILDLILERNENNITSLAGNQGINSPYTLVCTKNVEETDGVFYVGKITEANKNIDTKLRTGYKRINDTNFVYWVPVESRIIELLITEDDIPIKRFKYPNQIIWSDAYIRGSQINGMRNFRFENFINTSTEYGEIKKIVTHNNQIFIFCSRGVAVVSIGEVLASTASGETFVDSTRFLNSERWLLKNLSNIQPDSIKQYENLLFFSDGVDVWMFSDSLTNISNGAIRLNLSDNSAVGSLDIENKEYRITDNVHTFAYNFEIQEWFGPYTYRSKYSTEYKQNMYGVVGNKITQHNKSNLFGNKEYETIISSVANDENESSVNKLFRKFYLEVGGLASFFYGKDYNNKKEVNIEEKRKINNIYQIGVDAENKNANQIYWTVKSKTENFVLKLVSFVWTPRNRR